MIELATMGIWSVVIMLMLVLIKLGAMHQTTQVSNDMQECQMGTAKASLTQLTEINQNIAYITTQLHEIRVRLA